MKKTLGLPLAPDDGLGTLRIRMLYYKSITSKENIKSVILPEEQSS